MTTDRPPLATAAYYVEEIRTLRRENARLKAHLKDLKDHCAPKSVAESIIEQALQEAAA
jgi:cell division protein FtsB